MYELIYFWEPFLRSIAYTVPDIEYLISNFDGTESNKIEVYN